MPSSNSIVLDIFCGAGGFSHGFEQAGYTVAAGIDNDEDAIETYNANHDGNGYCIDITSIKDPAEWLSNQGIDATGVDVVIGGPPCQGFSVAGHRDADDPRNNLVHVFLDWVEALSPNLVMMENVKGILSMQEGAVIESVVERFESLGYNVEYRTLNAANYGVPQTRERVFVQACTSEVRWPEQTHSEKTEKANVC